MPWKKRSWKSEFVAGSVTWMSVLVISLLLLRTEVLSASSKNMTVWGDPDSAIFFTISPGCAELYEYPCPTRSSESECPPRVSCMNGHPKTEPIVWAISVMPTPGGPQRPMTEPPVEELVSHFATNSLILFLHSW